MRHWDRATRSELVARWGTPDGETHLAGDRRVLTWTSSWGFWLVGGSCRQSFTIGADDVVQGWSYSRCPLLQRRR